MIKRLILLLIVTITFCSCENYSKGERIGMITKFSNKGVMCKSWEGHLNATQTGMNSAEGFDFSIDNDKDKEEAQLVSVLDSAANEGWKVKLEYHEVFFKNWFSNRGETDYFVNDVIVLDRNMVNNNSNNTHGRIVDTIYVVIDKSKE